MELNPHLISQATEKDINEIAELVNSAYRGESSRLGWTTEADLVGGLRTTPSELRELIAHPQKALLCLREDTHGPILGSVLLERVDEVTFYLGMLAVNPRLQAQGIGKILIREAEAFARTRDAQQMRLSVLHRRHTLMAWYERRGYRRNGVEKPFGLAEAQDKNLRLVYFEKCLEKAS